MTAYYNEIDPYAAQWLRNLIAAGHIVRGDVDERDIRDVRPDELRGYTQCHFFAGIGVWSYALRLAGWPDDRPVWTGSCPCQPFSAAGRGAGFADERHLWPHFHHLIGQCRPPVVFGEQVASKDGLGWLDLVQADLEGSAYAVGAADLCVAGVGAPHIRQRLWWVGEDRLAHAPRVRHPQRAIRDCVGAAGTVEGGNAEWRPALVGLHGASGLGGDGKLADQSDTAAEGLQRCGQFGQLEENGRIGDGAYWPRPTNGFWRDADWLFCRDGKWRPVEPGTFPLAHGAPARVGRLRAYGNAISPYPAAEVIGAYLDAEIFL